MDSRVTLNLSQAADTLGVSVPTMRTLVNRADFPAFKIGTRWLISRSALEEWATSQAVKRTELEGIQR